MFTYPFEILKARLKAKVTDLKEVELYMGQDNQDDKDGWLVSAPAAFIQFRPTQTEDLSRRIQSGDVEFDVMLFTDCVIAEGSKRWKKDAPADHMKLLDKIHDALLGYSAKLSTLPAFVALANTSDDQRVMNSITRISIDPPHVPRKAVMKSIQRFKCTMWDHASLRNYTTPGTLPGLEVQVEV